MGFVFAAWGMLGLYYRSTLFPAGDTWAIAASKPRSGIQGTRGGTGEQLGRQLTLQITCRLIFFQT